MQGAKSGICGHAGAQTWRRGLAEHFQQVSSQIVCTKCLLSMSQKCFGLRDQFRVYSETGRRCRLAHLPESRKNNICVYTPARAEAHAQSLHMHAAVCMTSWRCSDTTKSFFTNFLFAAAVSANRFLPLLLPPLPSGSRVSVDCLLPLTSVSSLRQVLA